MSGFHESLDAALGRAGERDEVEELANALGDIRVAGARQAEWWTDDSSHSLLIQVLRAECLPWAEGLLASDWLAQRIEQAKAEERERIASAIERLRDGLGSQHYVYGYECGRDEAAHIAREVPRG